MSIKRRTFLKTLLLAAGGTFSWSACTRAGQAGSEFQPAYARLEAKGELASRVEKAYHKFQSCELCPRLCRVNRAAGEKGFCNATQELVVYSHMPHFGEEVPLVGGNGSGTIFFSNCNLRCVFCQNYPLAHEGRGRRVSDQELAEMMLDLQNRGCHNINLVTPTHVMPNILNATRIALQKGLHLPLCYNTGGYERRENIQLLEGIVDIYLPDLKFMDGQYADKYAVQGARDYPERAQGSILEMQRQVGELVKDKQGIAQRGLMLRHLVMPNQVAGTKEFVRWVAENLSLDTYLNIMSQYRVEHMAFEYEKINRAITSQEFVQAIEWAREAGLRNLDQRSLSSFEVHQRRML